MGRCLSIDIDQLILGRELSLPIHDSKGVLLAGPGTQITADLKNRLLSRGVKSVLLDEFDAAKVTLCQIDEETVFPELENKLNERLEGLIRSGMMSVRNTGPSVREKVVRHGRTGYNAEQQAKVAAENEENAAAVDEVLGDAINGEELDAERMDAVAESCINNLVADVDGMLTAGMAGGDGSTTVAEHSLNVSSLGMAIGMELGLDDANLRVLGIAGLLSDLGMIQVPRSVREAARSLTDVEFVEIQKHPIRTANILEHVQGMPTIVQIIAYQIHERPDGAGYPRGRTKQSIHPFAMILHVADAFTAMTSTRSYRPALMPYTAMTTLLAEAANGGVDPNAVRGLLNLVSLFPIGSFITLSDGSVAKVLRASPGNYMNPIVGRVQGADGGLLADDDSSLVDLSTSELQVIQALPTPGQSQIAADESRSPDGVSEVLA